MKPLYFTVQKHTTSRSLTHKPLRRGARRLVTTMSFLFFSFCRVRFPSKTKNIQVRVLFIMCLWSDSWEASELALLKMEILVYL